MYAYIKFYNESIDNTNVTISNSCNLKAILIHNNNYGYVVIPLI